MKGSLRMPIRNVNTSFSKIFSCVFWSFIFLATTVSFSGCGDKASTDQVQAAYADLPAPVPSTISIPLKIKVDELKKLINSQLEDGNMATTQSGQGSEDQRLSVKIKKANNIDLEVFSNRIRYRVPLDLDIAYDLSLTTAKAKGQLELDFNSTFRIDSSWNLITETRLNSHRWINEPKLQLGIVSLPISSISNYVIRRSQRTIEQGIDQAVANEVNLTSYIVDAWNQLQKPIMASEEYKAWLQINPTDLRMTPLRTSDEEISATITLEALPRIVFGAKAPSTLPAPFPKFSYDNRPAQERNFQLGIGSLVTYAEAERLAGESVLNETFESGGRSVTINDIRLFGNGGKLIIELATSGAYRGKIYLSGIPQYDSRQNRLEIRDLDFTLETKSLLTKTAGWLFKSTLKKKIQDNLNDMVTQNLDSMRLQIEEQLTNQQLAKGITLNGVLDQLALGSTYLTPAGIEVVVTITGDINLDVSGLTKVNK